MIKMKQFLAVLLSLFWALTCVSGLKESFTETVKLDEEDPFKCSFHFLYTRQDVIIKKSNVYCATENSYRNKKVFLLAPSGYRFTVLLNVNPTNIKAAKVSGEFHIHIIQYNNCDYFLNAPLPPSG